METITAYPLIHGNIPGFGFPSDYFIVKPDKFDDADDAEAQKYVSQAMANIENLEKGLRHAVFSVENYVVYGGISGVSVKLLQKYLPTYFPNETVSGNPIIDDGKGRKLTFFIGFCIKKQNTPNVPEIKISEIYEVYRENLKKFTCFSKLNDIKYLPSEEISLNCSPFQDSENHLLEKCKCNGKYFLSSYREENYEEIVQYFFYKLMNEDKSYSFLSDVSPYYKFDQFQYVSIADGYTTKSFENSSNVQSKTSEKNSSTRRLPSIDEIEPNRQTPTSNVCNTPNNNNQPAENNQKEHLLTTCFRKGIKAIKEWITPNHPDK